MFEMFEKQREDMVNRQLIHRGISDTRVIEAMKKVSREDFVPPDKLEMAYVDSPLPIGEGQTISQPYIVALMIEEAKLSPEDEVLDIGTGSGYAAAVISRIVRNVYAIEINEILAAKAEATLAKLGYDNIRITAGDGSMGWNTHAPYDAVIVAAGGRDVPAPLIEQLRIGGRLVIPVGGTPGMQELIRVTRIESDQTRREKITDVRFVPLVGKAGWPLT